MPRVLVIYHRTPGSEWLSTYEHNLRSLARFSPYDVVFFNTARRTMPAYAAADGYQLVIFHYTFLLIRQVSEEWSRILEMLAPIRAWSCPKVVIGQDEQVRMDRLSAFVRDFGVTRVFTPATESEWLRIYAETGLDATAFRRILTGYVDEAMVARTAERSRNLTGRPIDIGYRSWYTQPFYGSHGQLKPRIGELFRERAPAFGLVTDISNDRADAFYGTAWFDFLLRCKYTIGVEGGCSVFDWDGEIARCTTEYVRAHDDAPFEEIAAACFPGQDGGFAYFLISPRHLEAAMTRTCQVLVEGEYGGVLAPGVHYIELKRDFSNVDDVLELMRRDEVRAAMVERAYEDIVASGRYSYRAFADLVYRETLGQGAVDGPSRRSPLVRWNRFDEAVWLRLRQARLGVRTAIKAAARAVLGEARFARLAARVRGS